ncbi:MAG: mammalian cell entry protein [Frankiales bacterium]|nr:mammalian cell entry protein [Frankiales bacterium]
MRIRRLLALLVSLSLLGAVSGCLGISGGAKKHFSADFTRAIGVYKHSDVRVLGVKIGQVTKITPRGTKVHIEAEYDSSYKIPRDAFAVLLAPSIVSDRYVQLGPVYTAGDTLPDHAVITQTSQPVELDTIYQSIDQLDQALGPNGANKSGALSDLLKVGADNLNGNGDALHGTLNGLSKAVATLAGSRNDLFSTITNLQQFTTVLAQNDSTVRAFNTDLANVAGQLNGERTDLATAIRQLSVALAQVASFVKENKDNLTYNITNLASVTTVLVKQKRALREFLDVAPTALSNLQLAYNSTSGTLDTRDNSNSQGGAAGLLCNLLAVAGQSPTACNSVLGGIIPAPKQPAAKSSSARDLTLGGILQASR